MLQRRLWLAGEALVAAPVASAPRLYVDSLNGTFDAQSTRVASRNNRVPGAILALELLWARPSRSGCSLSISRSSAAA